MAKGKKEFSNFKFWPVGNRLTSRFHMGFENELPFKILLTFSVS